MHEGAAVVPGCIQVQPLVGVPQFMDVGHDRSQALSEEGRWPVDWLALPSVGKAHVVRFLVHSKSQKLTWDSVNSCPWTTGQETRQEGKTLQPWLIEEAASHAQSKHARWDKQEGHLW